MIQQFISNPRNSILSHFQSVFGRNFEVFGIVIRHWHGCLMYEFLIKTKEKLKNGRAIVSTRQTKALVSVICFSFFLFIFVTDTLNI